MDTNTLDVKAGRDAQATPAARCWSFGAAKLDEHSLELSVDGQSVELDRKPLEVLRHLLRHAGDVVTKDELLAAVWPGRIISDGALTSCMAKLREALQDQQQGIIKTIHGYGYRLIAPVRVTIQRAPPAPHFDFKPGDHPIGRPLWSLMRRLGTGGHGEAWLGQHDKTHEQRVFKFALDETSLGALKREITLFRLLNDTLGERARMVDLLDWNLEQPPCFVESRYMAGGSLVDWAERNARLGDIPLAIRLDVAAQVCDAVAGLHSVGVLHKDLKPSNILVEEISGAAPAIRLADFGSGALLDPARLDQLGITRHGFTRTVAGGEPISGTQFYLAPEVLDGQPPTVKADIFALGVVLYQLVLGDFRKSLSPGWELDIDDELLRECIAHAAQGEPERRLGDAAALAQRIRTLEVERAKRRLERETRDKAEALNRALEAAATSAAVADFLSKDLFAVVGSRPLRDLTVRELLEAASGKLADRFKDMPLAAAQIHAALGNAFFTMEAFIESEKHLDWALTLYERLEGPGSAAAVSVASPLVTVQSILGRLPKTMPRYDNILTKGGLELGRQHPAIFYLEHSLGYARLRAGDFTGAAEDFRTLIKDATLAVEPDYQVIAEAEKLLGFTLRNLGEFDAAERMLRESLSHFGASRGSHPMAVALAHDFRGLTLIELERFEEAEAELLGSMKLINVWVAGNESWRVASAQMAFGVLRLRQERIAEAIAVLENVLEKLATSNWNIYVDNTPEPSRLLAQAYFEGGRLDEAEAMMRKAVESGQRTFGPAHPWYQIARIGLAEIVCQRDDSPEARKILASIDRVALARLGLDHPFMAELFRVEGLVALAEDRPDDADQALTKALRIFEIRYGPGHKFSQRGRSELAKAATKPVSKPASKPT